MTDSTLGILGWVVTYVPTPDDGALPEYEIRHLDNRMPQYAVHVLPDNAGFIVSEYDDGGLHGYGPFLAKLEAFAKVGGLVVAEAA